MGPYSDALTARYHEAGVWQDRTWSSYVAEHAANRGDREAIVDQPDKQQLMGRAPMRLSWAEVKRHVDALALGLLDAGVEQGDVVFVQLPNSVEFVLAHLALDRIGAVGTFAPMRQRSSEITYAITKTKATAAICMGEFRGEDFLAMVHGAKDAEGSLLKTVVALGAEDRAEADFALEPMLHGNPSDTAVLDALEVSADEALTLCLTTGTESKPKVVPRTPNSWMVTVRAILRASGHGADSVFSGPFPYANMGGLGVEMYPWIMAGGKFVTHEPFDVDVFLQQITAERVNYIIAVPAIYFAMLSHPELDEKYDISSLNVVGCGGEAPPHTIIEMLDERGITVINEFGATEGWFFFTLPGQPLEERKDLFRVDQLEEFLPMTQFRALDPETGKDAAPGQPGELAVRGPSVFAGYLDADVINERSFTTDGLFCTGDLVTIGADRSLRYVGRLKDMIIRGGQNISPAEVELIIQRHPSVYEVSVIGLSHPERGQEVCAVASLKTGATLSLEELQQFMRDQGVARYKIPEALEIVEELPKGPSGKILKRSLRDRYDTRKLG